MYKNPFHLPINCIACKWDLIFLMLLLHKSCCHLFLSVSSAIIALWYYAYNSFNQCGNQNPMLPMLSSSITPHIFHAFCAFSVLKSICCISRYFTDYDEWSAWSVPPSILLLCHMMKYLNLIQKRSMIFFVQAYNLIWICVTHIHSQRWCLL